MIEFDETKGIAYVRLSGHIYESDIRHAFRRIVEDSRYKKGMSRLWDLGEADLSTLDKASFESLAKINPEDIAKFDKTKVAVVVTKDLDFGMMRMYEGLSYRDNYFFKPFRSFEDAENWLINQ